MHTDSNGDELQDGNSKTMHTDSNGHELQDGDSVILTQDLKLDGKNQVYKRGTVFKKIRLGDDPEYIRAGDVFLKTCYIKKKK